MEFWIDIKGYEGLYKVSLFGRVKSVGRMCSRKNNTPRLVPEKIMSNIVTDKGYEVVTISKNGESERFKVHRLVAAHFLLNPYDYVEVNHKDGNKRNNRAGNLEWCSRSPYDSGLKRGRGK